MTSATGTQRRTAVPGEELSDLLWETSAYVELLGEAALAGTGLTLAASGTLGGILEEPGITVAEMARRKPKSPQAFSQVLSRLEKQGLVERRLGPGRGIALHLTAAGEAKAREGIARESELRAQLLELLGEERYAALEALLAETRAIVREAR